jgi:ATP/maltotriose-dependent transcriptional regulator MalT
VSYVKFSAPVTPLALDRARLFNELDARRREFPVVWISSPAGSGKTTLVNTYLAANASPAIWFQFDEGDGDPPTFFHYLARSLGDTGAALPANVPDEPGELVRFARRFFREYFACMAAGTVIVFDNVHDFDWQRHADLMEIAFAEISPELNLLALSRIGPPARLSRLCLNGQMTTMDWNDLKFTQDEACAVAGISSPPDPSNLAWIKRVDGWATGICVLRGQEGDGTRPAGGFNEDREMILARYFSGEILDRLKADEQECLLMLSSLPTINVGDAERLTGNPRASRRLRNFYDNHLFIARDSGNSDTYTILPLFREYLESEIHYRFTPEQRNALQQRSAAMLDDKVLALIEI